MADVIDLNQRRHREPLTFTLPASKAEVIWHPAQVAAAKRQAERKRQLIADMEREYVW